MTSEASEQVGEVRQGEGAGADAIAGIPALLIAYNGAAALVRRPPPSISLPEHTRWGRLIRIVHLRLRPTWFAERWMARQLRRRISVLERGMARRLALGAEPTREEVRDREALRHFHESLAPRVSALVAVAGFAFVIVVAQAVTSVLTVYGPKANEIARALAEIDVAALDPLAISEFLGALGKADLYALFGFVMGLLASGYIVGRGPSSGYRLARLALGEPDGLGVPRRHSTLSRSVAALKVREMESAVFAAISLSRPREIPFDLAIKALMAVGWMVVVIVSLRDLADPSDHWEFYLFGALASLRLLWLARASVVRGAGVAWLVVPLALIVGGTMIAAVPDPSWDPSQDRAADPELGLTLSLQRDLSGVDLRGRDLTRVHLPHKDLRQADLSEATLADANLTGATLRGANLSGATLSNAELRRADVRNAKLYGAKLFGADLVRADLRRADLSGADLDWATLCAADLRGATLDGITGHPSFDKRTRWPAGFTPPPRGPDPC